MTREEWNKRWKAYYERLTPEQKRIWDEMTKQSDEQWDSLLWEVLTGQYKTNGKV